MELLSVQEQTRRKYAIHVSKHASLSSVAAVSASSELLGFPAWARPADNNAFLQRLTHKWVSLSLLPIQLPGIHRGLCLSQRAVQQVYRIVCPSSMTHLASRRVLSLVVAQNLSVVLLTAAMVTNSEIRYVILL